MEKSTRIIDLNIGQLQTIINEVINESSNSRAVDDLAAPMNSFQACEFLGMPKPTLYYKLKHENLPGILQGGKYFFFKKDLVDWIRAQPKNPKEEKRKEFLNEFIGNLKHKINK
jgi:hypothetical protein